jgi:hypothetical protein
VPKVLQKCDLKTQQALCLEGIKKLRDIHEEKTTKPKLTVLCALCYDQPALHLLTCIVQLHTKEAAKSGGDRQPNISNFLSHLQRKTRAGDAAHVAFHAQYEKDRKKAATGGISSQHSDVMSVGTVRTVGTAATGIRSITTTTQHPYSEWVGLSRAQLINKMHELLYILVNDANIPAHVVRNTRLWDVIEFAVNNGRQMSGAGRSGIQMGRFKYNTMQAISFGRMVTTIQRLVADTKEYFARFTKKRVPFIYVGHDIWDGKNKSVLGLCLFIASPLLERLVILPVAMLRNRGKDSVSIANQALQALKR